MELTYHQKLVYESIERGGGKFMQLENGKLLNNQYGKYQPQLTFIVENFNDLEPVSDPELADLINADWDGSPEFIFGEYKISKKGTKCFYTSPKERAKHILVCLHWQHSHFGHTNGNTVLQQSIYDVRRRSNGGGEGYHYYVIPVGGYNVYREEDI